MKKIFSFSFVVLFVLTSFGQKIRKPQIDNEYFLIGTLGDYMGRDKYCTNFVITKY